MARELTVAEAARLAATGSLKELEAVFDHPERLASLSDEVKSQLGAQYCRVVDAAGDDGVTFDQLVRVHAIQHLYPGLAREQLLMRLEWLFRFGWV